MVGLLTLLWRPNATAGHIQVKSVQFRLSLRRRGKHTHLKACFLSVCMWKLLSWRFPGIRLHVWPKMWGMLWGELIVCGGTRVSVLVSALSASFAKPFLCEIMARSVGVCDMYCLQLCKCNCVSWSYDGTHFVNKQTKVTVLAFTWCSLMKQIALKMKRAVFSRISAHLQIRYYFLFHCWVKISNLILSFIL